MKKLEMIVEVKSFVSNGEVVEYLECFVILNGVQVRFKPVDRTGRLLLESVFKQSNK